MNRSTRGIFNLVTATSGRALRPMELYVPRIDDAYLDIALYLYQTPQSASEGEEAGGSGFLVGVPVEGQPPEPRYVGPARELAATEQTND